MQGNAVGPWGFAIVTRETALPRCAGAAPEGSLKPVGAAAPPPGRALGHQPAALVEEVAAAIGALELVRDGVGERGFDHLAGVAGALRRSGLPGRSPGCTVVQRICRWEVKAYCGGRRCAAVTRVLAEREGFEPPIRLPVCRISSAVLSTTQPPLQASVGRDISRRWPGTRQAACERFPRDR